MLLYKFNNFFQQNLFSKCDICVQFSQERLKAAGNKPILIQLRTEFKHHLDLIE